MYPCQLRLSRLHYRSCLVAVVTMTLLTTFSFSSALFYRPLACPYYRSRSRLPHSIYPARVSTFNLVWVPHDQHVLYALIVGNLLSWSIVETLWACAIQRRYRRRLRSASCLTSLRY